MSDGGAASSSLGLSEGAASPLQLSDNPETPGTPRDAQDHLDLIAAHGPEHRRRGRTFCDPRGVRCAPLALRKHLRPASVFFQIFLAVQLHEAVHGAVFNSTIAKYQSTYQSY